MTSGIAAIIPTIGRPASLECLLASMARQTVKVDEIVIADGSDEEHTAAMVERWVARGLPVRHIRVSPPNAVRQRIRAISESRSKYLLLLDDDVELEPSFVEELLAGMRSDEGVVAVVADFSNEQWSGPTTAWRWYLRHVVGLGEGEWQGKVVGPLLRFGFYSRDTPRSMEWLGTCMSLVSREAYEKCGGFSDFFLHRCTMNEDVDLGLKIRRVGKIVFWPRARAAHYHAPTGRVSVAVAAEDDVFNRFWVLHRTLGNSRPNALWLVSQFVLIETASNVIGSIRRRRIKNTFQLAIGRTRGFWRVLRSAKRIGRI